MTENAVVAAARAGSEEHAAIVPRGTQRFDASGSKIDEFPERELRPVESDVCTEAVAAVVGHHWDSGKPSPLDTFAACVDDSAGLGGPLVADRWSGGTEPDTATFVAG